MANGIYSALTGAIAQQRSLDVAANNVANVNTTSFRADRVAFSEVLARNNSQSAPAGSAVRYVGVADVRQDLSQGSIRNTGNPFDLALQGDAYFVLRTPQGERYTRDGSLVLDQEGIIRTHEGHAVMNASEKLGQKPAEIRIPPQTIRTRIDQDGQVYADDQPIGQIALVQFGEPNSLTREGLTLYSATDTSRLAKADNVDLLQGHIETSNVNSIHGMNELITITRSFEAFQKVIDAFQQLDTHAARDIASRT